MFLALGSYGIYRSRHERVSSSSQEPIVLAVLPFANQTGVLANDYLSEGLTDNLIRQLAELPQIRVASREAVSGPDPRKVARDLGAAVLLTGELQRNSSGQLVLNAEISNAKDGTVMRSSQYFPDEKDLRSVQADIVQEVIQTLGLQLNEREHEGVLRPLTTSPSAFQDFLRGESEMLKGDEASIVSALHILQNAVHKDPEFAEAWTAMAAGEIQIGLFFEPPGSHMEAARQYAERAIALDPSISDAHGVLGLVYLVYDWNFVAAQSQLASANNREDAIWHLGCTAHLLNTSGGSSRHAEEDLEHMLEFNPGAVMIVNEMGCVNYYAGRYDESVRYYRDALASAPGFVLANWGLGRSLGREGKYSEAIADLRRFNSVYGIEHPLTLGEIGYLQALSGDRAGALATIHKLEAMGRTQFIDPIFIAQSYLGLHDRAQTYAWLDRAYKIRSPFLIGLATDPRWASLRGERRFKALWNRMTGEADSSQGIRSAARQQGSSSSVTLPRQG
ncbi:MAG: tetratricopeptide repeat protein [Terracidiphilus sp.]